jgi:hypothetical protein
MRFLLHATYALVGFWGVISIGSVIDPSFLPHTAGLVHSVLHASARLV